MTDHGPFGRSLLAALGASTVLLTLRGDGPALRHVDVGFVGSGPESADAAYLRYRDALQPWRTRGSTYLRLHRLVVREDPPQALRDDLVTLLRQRKVDVVVAVSGIAASAAASARGRENLVFASFPDPVAFGLVDTMQRPGRRTTGVSLADHLHGKRLELLRDAYPSLRRIGVLGDRGWASRLDLEQALHTPARALGLSVNVFVADSEAEVDALFKSPGAAGVQAWYVAPTLVADLAMPQILGHLRRLGVPAIHTSAAEMNAGALMAYAQDSSFVYGSLAELTARVASGVDAGDIPVQRPRRFVLSVRPRDEPASLRLPAQLVDRADRIY